MFDLDEDGVISKAEMLAIVDSIYRMIGDTDKLQEEIVTFLLHCNETACIIASGKEFHLQLEGK